MYLINYTLVFRKKDHKYWHNGPLLKIRKAFKSSWLLLEKHYVHKRGHDVQIHQEHTSPLLPYCAPFIQLSITDVSDGNIKLIKTNGLGYQFWLLASLNCLKLKRSFLLSGAILKMFPVVWIQRGTCPQNNQHLQQQLFYSVLGFLLFSSVAVSSSFRFLVLSSMFFPRCGEKVIIIQVMLSHPVPSPEVSGAKQWSSS